MKFAWPAVVRHMLLLLIVSPTSFAAAAPKADCFGFDALDDDPAAVQVYEVQPGDKVAFQCPEKSVLCRKGAFVVPGDQVVVSRIVGERACADYLAPARKAGTRATSGWLPLARLAQVSPAAAWSGRWSRDEVTLVARPDGDKVRIDAKAEMQFGHGTEYGGFAALVDAGQTQARFGYESGEGGHDEKFLPYQDKAPAGVCQVRMAQLGRYVVVADNHMCGGVNVSLSGVYGRIDEAAAAMPAASKPATAQPSDGLRSSYRTCLDKSGGTTSQMQDCIGNEYRYQDDRLNKVYGELRQKLGKAGATELRDEQRRWITERDKACAPDRNSGTAALLDSNSCELDRTARRARELEGRLSR